MASNVGDGGAGKELIKKMNSLRAILTQAAISVVGNSYNIREIRNKMMAEKDAVVEFFQQHQAHLSVNDISRFSKLFKESMESVDQMLTKADAKIEEKIGAAKELMEKMNSLRALLSQAILSMVGDSSNMREVGKKMKAEKDAVMEFYQQHQPHFPVDNISQLSELFEGTMECVDQMLTRVDAKINKMEEEEESMNAEREMKIKKERGNEVVEKMSSLLANLSQAILVGGDSSNMREVRNKIKEEKNAVMEFYQQHQAHRSVDGDSSDLLSKLFTENMGFADKVLMKVDAMIDETEKEEKAQMIMKKDELE